MHLTCGQTRLRQSRMKRLQFNLDSIDQHDQCLCLSLPQHDTAMKSGVSTCITVVTSCHPTFVESPSFSQAGSHDDLMKCRQIARAIEGMSLETKAWSASKESPGHQRPSPGLRCGSWYCTLQTHHSILGLCLHCPGIKGWLSVETKRQEDKR